MNYKKAYEELKEKVKEKPYCNNCYARGLDEEHEEYRCDDCHRKMMMWKLDPKIIESIEENAK